MANTISSLKNRISLLETRNPMGNETIVKKLKRTLRKLEK